jgi:hypothetical protein
MILLMNFCLGIFLMVGMMMNKFFRLFVVRYMT